MNRSTGILVLCLLLLFPLAAVSTNASAAVGATNDDDGGTETSEFRLERSGSDSSVLLDGDFASPSPLDFPPYEFGALDLQAATPDPWNPSPWYFQTDTLGVDQIEAWICHIDDSTSAITMSDVIALLEGPTSDWFNYYSGGLLKLDVTVGGTVYASSTDECEALVKTGTSGQAEVAVVITNVFAVAGTAFNRCCLGGFPENDRLVFLDGDVIKSDWPRVAVHELAHTMQWPHIQTSWGIMGGLGKIGSINAPSALYRYRSGWINPADVVVFEGGTTVFDLKANMEAGPQMLVIATNAEYRFISIAARVHNEMYDDLVRSGLLAPQEGVEVVVSDYRCDYIKAVCKPLNEPSVIKGGIVQVGETVDLGNPDNYQLNFFDEPPFEGVPVTLEVLAKNGNTVTVKLTGEVPELVYTLPDFLPPPDSGTFIDDDGHIFETAIEWLADQGITKGCNPPVNDRFCPDDNVTRGQMAAFLVRALGYTDDGGGDLFTDDDNSVFESAIDKLRTASVTMGCNPPANTKFCPDDLVTRGQMAAFLVRAFGYTDDGGGDLFTDDDSSIFETAIDKLGTAGVTRGCNPPTNNLFCPDGLVTRGQMAAFLERSLAG